VGPIKQAILKLPSGSYIKEMKPGTGIVPPQWEQTPDHLDRYIKIQYIDYLAASSKFFIFSLFI
jgi:hypothetical protein